MILVILLDIVAVALLCVVTFTKGFERALPLAAFLLLLFPNESQIQLPGLFDLTTQRIIIAALVVLYLTFRRRPEHAEEKRQIPFKYLIFLIIGWMLLSSANSVVPNVSFKATVSEVFDYFVLYFIYAKTVSSVDTVRKILFGFVSGMFVCSIFGAVEAYTGWSVLSVFPPTAHRFSALGDTGDRGVRVHSTFGHAILFGAALAVTIPIALYLLTVVKSNLHKAFLWTAVMLMFADIYKTESRGPWLALVLSLVILLVFGKGKLRRQIVMIGALTALVLIARPGVWETIFNLYGETIDPVTVQGQSYEWRYMLYRVSQRELSKSVPRSLWGYGPESFYYLGLTSPFLVDGEVRNVKVESCDSTVVELMTDTGYVGFLLVVLLLLKAAWVTMSNFLKVKKPENQLFVVFMANLAAFCFLMTNVELFGWGQQTYLLWIGIALSMIYPSLLQPVQEESLPVAVTESRPLLAR